MQLLIRTSAAGVLIWDYQDQYQNILLRASMAQLTLDLILTWHEEFVISCQRGISTIPIISTII